MQELIREREAPARPEFRCEPSTEFEGAWVDQGDAARPENGRTQRLIREGETPAYPENLGAPGLIRERRPQPVQRIGGCRADQREEDPSTCREFGRRG